MFILKELRDAAGLRQDELAKKAGVSRGTIVNYENNPSSVKLSILARLAKALGVHSSAFFRDYEDGEEIEQ